MGFSHRPLNPLLGDCCNRESCVRMPLFNCEPRHSHSDSCGCGQTVRLENPCCPGECADVTLSVDSCGNLVICVHREPCRCSCCLPVRHCH